MAAILDRLRRSHRDGNSPPSGSSPGHPKSLPHRPLEVEEGLGEAEGEDSVNGLAETATARLEATATF
jgi:hypothetical protein